MAETDYKLVISEINAAGRSFAYNEELEVLDEEEPVISTAYFAEKKIENAEEAAGTHTYTFTNTNDTSTAFKKNKIASVILSKVNKDEKSNKKHTTQALVRAQLTLGSYTAGNTITVDLLKSVEKISYPRITSAPMGYQVYLIAETKNLKDKKVKLKIHEKESDLKLLKTKDDVLPVLVFAKKEDTTTNTEASDWITIDVKEENGKKEGDALVLHKEDKGDTIEVGIKKIQLRPKEDKIKTEGEDAFKSFEGWQEALYIREDETDEGKKAIEDAKALAETRKNETFITLIRDADADKKENKKSFPKKISGPKTISIDKDAVYTIDSYGTSATEDDKKNVRWSFYVQGDPKATTADKEKTYIDTKKKAGWYTYAKSEIVNNKNQLTLVFDKALIGKKVQIEAFRGLPDINNAKDYVRTTTVQKKPIPKIAKRESTSLWLTSQCENVENAGEMIEKEFKNYFKLITPDTIHIYHDGYISKLNLEALTKVKYRYHNAKGGVYQISTCDLLEIDERLKGKAHDQSTPHTVETGYDANNVITYSHASSRKKYTYSDGTIRTYGKYEGDYRRVVYKKGKEKKLIVKLPMSLIKKIGEDKIIQFKFEKTTRTCCGPEHYACFLGALAEVSYKDIVSGGMCEDDGTCFPSTTHNNGQSVDTNYLTSNIREQKFINAMYKFGFEYQLRGFAKHAFNHTTPKSHHNSHLHSGGLKPKYKK